MRRKKLYTFLFGTWRSALYDVRSLLPVSMPTADRDPIDIVIPVIEKDMDILPLCLEGLRRNCNNTVDGIYLVAPPSPVIMDFARANGLTFTDENTVLGYGVRDIGYTDRNGNDRSGWIFQQLLKLSGNVGTRRHYVTIDADHILMRPHTFLAEGGRPVFYMSKEYYFPYYLTQQALTGRFPMQQLSYIAHKMIFDKQQLAVLHAQLEQGATAGTTWDRVIVDTLRRTPLGSFSEFELYGHCYPADRKLRVPWRQKELRKSSKHSVSYDELARLFPKALSVTFPDYRKED
ncbi:MAG: hypothetical protein IJ527_09975 [Prevotella sp.]|nr:hypothetical protein [Prevotella sp.]